MRVCRCGGFVPEGVARCPNCRERSSRKTLRLLSLLAGAQAITACNCYGGPPTTCFVPLRDGGTVEVVALGCAGIDCLTPLPDGGDPSLDRGHVCSTGR